MALSFVLPPPYFRASKSQRSAPSVRERDREMPGLTIGDRIPDLDVETTHGRVKLHDFVGESWAVIFSHPGTRISFSLSDRISDGDGAGDFTPVCTTELGRMALQEKEFSKRGVKLLGVSCEDVKSHLLWIKDIEHFTVTSPRVMPSKKLLMI